ncbi:MAG: hypothetical protein P8M25_16855, partial [Paracoccaceae bacterium]|nr:hypothetical protein [Paracoccaceae bacterium]
QGTFTFTDGSKYAGEFRDDRPNGQGTWTYSNGNKYVGEFRDGNYYGQGTFTFADGSKYIGEFRDDKYHGQGALTFDNGERYVGEFRDSLPNGQGAYTFANSAKYVGKFKDGEWHGQGTYTFADGDKFVGEHRDGNPYGQGVFLYANGEKYAGEFRDSKWHGQATEVFFINITELKYQLDSQREIQARAKQGDPDAQYKLGLSYDKGEGVPQDKQGAMKWYDLAAKQGNADAQERYGELVVEDFVYGSDIQKLEHLSESVETLCKGNIKCAFDEVWAYLDITHDGRLSLAEIARFQRNLVKFVAVHQDENVLEVEEIAAINLASIMVLPLTASSILHSFDYNNDGLLSKNEVLGDTEFSELVGVDTNALATGLDFQSLGEELQNFMTAIPFLK